MSDTSSTTSVIDVENLVFDYPTTRALCDVSFKVARGSVTALVGPNGAGKTTLLRCMAALDTPYSGRVLIDGTDGHEDPRTIHRKIGYLSDSFGLYDELTVRQCLRHAVALHGIGGADETSAVARVVGQLDLGELTEKRAGELSRGQRQRLAIAQSIVHKPELVLLDEPASGLDPLARMALSELLLGLRADGMTLIVSSHILAELEDYCTDVLVIDRGRVVEHRAIELADGTRFVVYAIELAEATDGMIQRLMDDKRVSEVVATDDLSITFRAPRDAVFRRDLLRRLVGEGMPVTGLSEKKLGLTDIYREVAKSDEGQS
ncbi:MAG: ABC transporter ATP-binding protein [Rhodospirillales bacterium]|nr:ABC transporter ATP-binding protein [Rhodospirillales bacterium]